MKIKNIMFTGFMAAILMSATGAASAAISVASKGYVDEMVGGATADITALEATVGANKTAAETATKKVADDLASYQTSNNAAVQKNAADIATNATAIETEKNARIAADSGLDERLQEVEKFSGNGEGSVAKQIADAVTVEKNARVAADEALQGEIDAINDEGTGILAQAKADATSKDTALETKITDAYTAADAQTLADAKADATSKDTALETKITDAYEAADEALQGEIDAINDEGTGILAQAKAYTDAEDTKIKGTIGTIAEGDTVSGLISENKSAIQQIEEAYIAKPAACQNTYCVLSVNGENISWMPLTEPVENFMGE